MKVHLALTAAMLVAALVLAVAFAAFMEMTTSLLELAERIVGN